jgi:hypothetical protein
VLNTETPSRLGVRLPPLMIVITTNIKPVSAPADEPIIT